MHALRSEAVVPANGALASEMNAAPAEAHRYEYPPYDVEGLPDARHDEAGTVYNTGKVRALRPGESQSGLNGTGAHRPPVLASEVLREDLSPLEPGLRAVRWVNVGCGVTTLLLALMTLGLSSAGVAVAALGAGLITVGLLPLPYAFRATVQVALATALLAGSAVASLLLDTAGEPGMALPVAVLSTGLLFRSWHRASRHARIVVATGIALAAVWLGWVDNVNAIFATDPHWQTMVPAIARLMLAPVLLVSLLAFMGETTTGGCAAWAATVLVWYGAVALLAVITRAWPVDAITVSWPALQQGTTAATLLSALAVPVLAIGSAQLMVVAASESKPAT